MTKEQLIQLMEPGTLRYSNMRYILQHNDYQNKVQKLKDIEQFISNFSYLSFGRDFIMCHNNTLSLRTIVISLELTAGSIVSCSQFGCLADANSLLRKYRDDMFFYLYLIVYEESKNVNSSELNTTTMADNIERWIKNNLSNLQIGDVLKAIAQSPTTKEAVRNYKLKTYFDQLGARLNNYVHSNGVKFYNRNVISYNGHELLEQLNSLVTDMRFITINFLFLLSLCAPHFIMSTEYVDDLDCGLTPPDGSQYWVAPFIVDFFKENLHLIDKSCIDYLRDNTPMEFD